MPRASSPSRRSWTSCVRSESFCRLETADAQASAVFLRARSARRHAVEHTGAGFALQLSGQGEAGAFLLPSSPRSPLPPATSGGRNRLSSLRRGGCRVRLASRSGRPVPTLPHNCYMADVWKGGDPGENDIGKILKFDRTLSEIDSVGRR